MISSIPQAIMFELGHGFFLSLTFPSSRMLAFSFALFSASTVKERYIESVHVLAWITSGSSRQVFGEQKFWSRQKLEQASDPQMQKLQLVLLLLVRISMKKLLGFCRIALLNSTFAEAPSEPHEPRSP